MQMMMAGVKKQDPAIKQAVVRRVVDACKKVRYYCPHCNEYNGSVKRSGGIPLAFKHERFGSAKNLVIGAGGAGPSSGGSAAAAASGGKLLSSAVNENSAALALHSGGSALQAAQTAAGGVPEDNFILAESV
ncbi:unnamed protein product, partial [Amoebophrya sp. A120]|eukprot:GSA120T00021788001.1